MSDTEFTDGDGAQNDNPDPIQALDWGTLQYLDEGLFARSVTQCLWDAIRDIRNRPCDLNGATESREVTIKLKMTPRVSENHITRSYELSGIDLESIVGSKIPAVRGGKTDVRISGNAVPVINVESPNYFEQRTLNFERETE